MAYSSCKLCKSLDDFAKVVDVKHQPHVVIIGSPAAFHGSDLPGADLEIQVLKRFPKAALFIEKPISAAPVANALNLAHYLENHRVIASVGYMLRYLKVIQHMKNIIEETGKPVMMTVARYVSSYAKIKSEVWWDKSKSCGPIVEQGTHLVDLCRYFGGAVVLDSVQATSTEHFEEAGYLEAIPINEQKIPEDLRNPRTTSALWKYENGGIASFTHALTLQGTKYATELEVYLDGWQLKVTDLYNDPVLLVRSPDSDAEERHTFTDDDPYYGEVSALIDATEAGNDSAIANDSAIVDEDDDEIIPPTQTHEGILSSFRDACGTYALTWAIKEASEKALKTKKFDHLAEMNDTKVGTLVGTDHTGNKYYENNAEHSGRNRWVDYAQWEFNGTQVPPEWRGWLNHIRKDPPHLDPLMISSSPTWKSSHLENLTGTRGAYKSYSTTKPKYLAWEPKVAQRT
ncbi:MAG: hypothetical protein CYPHOPRED_004555 [Cyphobasidiales sp. Tagirdzhanova-0007]|nr:MAG: hypothetical protein CYPHOPRED_004555 [Cyphobasidiales sp. Tagirdzhanova-0007]